MPKTPLQQLSKQELIDRLERYEQFDKLLDATEKIAHIGHYEWDFETDRLTYCSEEYAQLFGMTQTETLEAQSSWEKTLSQIHPDDLEEYRVTGDLIKSSTSFDMEYRIIRKDGEIRHVREISVVTSDKDGSNITNFGILQDVTEAEKHRRDLEHRDLLAQQAEEITDIGYFIFDLVEESYDYLSPGFARIHGVTTEEYLSRVQSRNDDMDDVYHEDYARLANVYKEHATQGSGFSVEYRIHRADGEIRWIREVSRGHTVLNGKTIKSIGVLQDITPMKENQYQLEHREMLARQAEAITDIGHFIFDEEKAIYDYVSPGCSRIHGKSIEDLMTKHSHQGFLDRIHPEDKEKVVSAYQRLIDSGEDSDIVYRLYNADGHFQWIRELGKTHDMQNGKVRKTLGVMQDITVLKRQEEMLNAAKSELENTVKERTSELADTVKQLQEEVIEREKIAAELKFLANHDALTGLPGIRLCKDRLERSILESRRNNLSTAVMFLDLDGFKSINDSFGHESGDIVLKATADRIRASIRDTDTVARIGGDEFIVILTGIPDIEIIHRMAPNLIEQISQPVVLDHQEVYVGASIGISLYPQDGHTPEELIRKADGAMYRIKHAGKNDFGFVRANTLN